LPGKCFDSDAHPGNLIRMRDGTMVPIDLHVDKFPEAMPDELRDQTPTQS
jgi:predicted unusual protein kinase regulating ubiquinone biosynthesis (AarF/ABC1/UbiB family)